MNTGPRRVRFGRGSLLMPDRVLGQQRLQLNLRFYLIRPFAPMHDICLETSIHFGDVVSRQTILTGQSGSSACTQNDVARNEVRTTIVVSKVSEFIFAFLKIVKRVPICSHDLVLLITN